MKSSSGGMSRQSIVVLLLILAFGLMLIFAITAAFRSLTRTERMDAKQEADQFVSRILKTHSSDPQVSMQHYLKLRSDLKILASEFWVIEKNRRILASTTSQSLPELSDDFLETVNSEDEFQYQVNDGNVREIVGISKFSSAGTFLVSSQVSGGDVASRLARTYFLAIAAGFSVAILISFTAVYFYLRSRARIVRGTFAQITAGNLAVRVPVTRLDEIGEIAVEFNAVADQLVQLIGQVRASESGRMALLKELTHDLRSPIATLRGMIETLIEYGHRMSPDKVASTLTTCQLEVDNMQNLTENLLFLAEMKGEKYRTKSETVDLLGLLRAEISTIENRLEKTRPKLTIKFLQLVTSDSFFAKGDPVLLQRALRNVLENAIRYSHENIEVKVETAPDLLNIAISDDGPGFPKQFVTGFDVLANGYLADAHQAKPLSGLGLLICFQIVKLHAGLMQIGNKSEGEDSGSGAKVRISIPLLKSAEAEPK